MVYCMKFKTIAGNAISSRLKMLSLSRKSLLGYVFILFIPILIMTTMFIYLLRDENLRKYSESRQQAVNDAKSVMESELDLVEHAYIVLSTNSILLDYLGGEYQTPMDVVYYYGKDIRPMFFYVQNSYPLVSNISIYKKKDYILGFKPEVLKWTQLPDKYRLDEQNNGGWDVQANKDNSQLPDIRFYERIYAFNYSEEVGMLEITISTDKLIQTFNTVNKDVTGYICLLDNNGKIIYENDPKFFSKNRKMEIVKSAKSDNSPEVVGSGGGEVIVNRAQIPRLGLTLVSARYPATEMSNYNKYYLFAAIFAVLLLLFVSVYYNYFGKTITHRINRLARHMSHVDLEKLANYSHEDSGDEIGILANTFNSMIGRITELINTVHKNEILSQEAAFAALQAQIRPHFLFNTLEALRMLALEHGDAEIEDLCFSFSRMFHYAMSSSDSNLQNELVNAEDYLKLYKLRRKHRFNYTIEAPANLTSLTCPRSILQPLIENSIKHGFISGSKEWFIRISAEEDETAIRITVVDNGVGILQDRLDDINAVLSRSCNTDFFNEDHEKGGIGLYNVNERILMFFGKDSYLKLSSEVGKGTVCTIRLAKRNTEGDKDA